MNRELLWINRKRDKLYDFISCSCDFDDEGNIIECADNETLFHMVYELTVILYELLGNKNLQRILTMEINECQ